MSMETVNIRPGINRQATQMLNEGGWSYSGFIRFRDGFAEKIKGWARFVTDELVGICRFIMAWQSLSAVPYLAFGTHKRLYVYNGNLYDITPIRATSDLSNALDTTDTDETVNITDVAHGAVDGDGIYIVTPVSIGGIVLHGYYEITKVDDDNYTIESSDAATATVSNGGAVAVFDTTNTDETVTVTLADHGYEVDQIYTVYVSTSVGGLTLQGDYVIATVPDTDTLTFEAATAASSTDTQSENSGNVKVNYLLASGLEDAAPVTGYGLGGYGLGPYGIGVQTTGNAPPRRWSGFAWGEDALFSPTNGAVYLWDSSGGVFDNEAAVISQAPDNNTQILLAMPQRQVISLGAEDNGSQDKMLVKWSDIDDYTDWRDIGDPYAPNSQAGYYRIPKGGEIMGGRVIPHQIMIWTDVGLWLMQYLQPPLLYGFNEIATGCGLIGPKAMGGLGSVIVWMSQEGFFSYNIGGGVRPVPCPVWDTIFDNMDRSQAFKVECEENTQTGEISWSIPTSSGENDLRVKLNVYNGHWDYTFDTESNIAARTAWLDWSIWGEPIAVRADGTVCQHEIGSRRS